MCIRDSGDIGLDVLPATAVIRLQEAVHQRVHIGLRVPQQLGQQIGAQLAELAALIRIALFKNTRHIVLDQELDVGLQNTEVRIGVQIEIEVRGVVPYINVLGQLAPTLEIVGKRTVHRAFIVVQRRIERAVEGAETDDDVIRGFGLTGGLGIHVGQGVHLDMGILFLHFGGYLIDRPDDRARRTALFLNNGGAFFTAAIGGRIVLGDRDNVGIGILRQQIQRALSQDFDDLRIAQAKGGCIPAAADGKAEVFRMRVVILVGGQQGGKGISAESFPGELQGNPVPSDHVCGV